MGLLPSQLLGQFLTVFEDFENMEVVKKASTSSVVFLGLCGL